MSSTPGVGPFGSGVSTAASSVPVTVIGIGSVCTVR